MRALVHVEALGQPADLRSQAVEALKHGVFEKRQPLFEAGSGCFKLLGQERVSFRYRPDVRVDLLEQHLKALRLS